MAKILNFQMYFWLRKMYLKFPCGNETFKVKSISENLKFLTGTFLVGSYLIKSSITLFFD